MPTAQNLTALLPQFLTQTQTLHDQVVPIAIFIAVIGVVIRACLRPDWMSLGWTVVRLLIIAIVVANVANWALITVNTVNALTTAVGAGTAANAAQQFSNFVNTKFSTMGTGNNPWLWLFQAGQAIGLALITAVIALFAFLAEIIIWISTGVQYLYLSILIALSPVFLACLMIPQIANLGVRFATRIVAVCCWPFGWMLASIITQIMLTLAINTTNNTSGQAQVLSAGIILWTLAISIWIIVSTIGAPRMISHLIVTDGSLGIARLAATSFGVGIAGANMAASGVTSVAGSGVASAGAAATGVVTAPNYATWANKS